MAPFKFIDRVFNGFTIQQYGDGSTSRDYTYIDDIVDGVVGAIDTPLGYQVGGGTGGGGCITIYTNQSHNQPHALPQSNQLNTMNCCNAGDQFRQWSTLSA